MVLWIMRKEHVNSVLIDVRVIATMGREVGSGNWWEMGWMVLNRVQPEPIPSVLGLPFTRHVAGFEQAE